MTLHLTHDTCPPKAENKRYSEPDFKKIDNPYTREKFSPRNIRFVPRGLYLDLYIDFLAILAHYLQVTHAVAWNHLCNRAIYLSLDMIPPKVYCNYACSWCWVHSIFQMNKTEMLIWIIWNSKDLTLNYCSHTNTLKKS